VSSSGRIHTIFELRPIYTIFGVVSTYFLVYLGQNNAVLIDTFVASDEYRAMILIDQKSSSSV